MFFPRLASVTVVGMYMLILGRMADLKNAFSYCLVVYPSS